MKIGHTLYFDHQATTPLDSRVLEAMQPYLAEGFGNPHSADHATGWRAAQAVDRSAAEIAAMIGGDADEIIFTSGATEANNLALLGIGRRAMGGDRKRVLLGATEHKCILEIGRVLRDAHGYDVIHIPVDSEGRIDLNELEDQLAEDVLMVSIMAANNEIGTLQDIPEISDMVARYGALLHCDGAQAPCAMDMTDFVQCVDLLSLSGHKMYGPMGIGALYVRRDLHKSIEPLIYGGGQQGGLRSGTLPTALCAGFGAAARIAVGDAADAERAALARRRDMFAKGMEDLPCRVWFNGSADPSYRHPGNVNVGFEGIFAADLLGKVQPRLAASSGSACTSGISEPSHVLRAIGLSDEHSSSSIRFSLGRGTTDDDVNDALDIIGSTLEELTESGLLEIG